MSRAVGSLPAQMSSPIVTSHKRAMTTRTAKPEYTREYRSQVEAARPDSSVDFAASERQSWTEVVVRSDNSLRMDPCGRLQGVACRHALRIAGASSSTLLPGRFRAEL